jgi:hypothetical protein
VDAGFGAEAAAEVAMRFGVIPFVREHGADAGHNGEGGQEQALEDEGVVDVGGCRNAGDGVPFPVTATWYLVPRLPRSVGLGPVSSPPRLARTEQLSTIGSELPRSIATSVACTRASTPSRAQASKQRRSVEPLTLSRVARKLRHGVPSRRNWRKVASTRTVTAGGCPGPGSRGCSQHSITVAIRSKILLSNAVLHGDDPTSLLRAAK